VFTFADFQMQAGTVGWP